MFPMERLAQVLGRIAGHLLVGKLELTSLEAVLDALGLRLSIESKKAS